MRRAEGARPHLHTFASKPSALWPGMPHMRSTLTFSEPGAETSMARQASSEESRGRACAERRRRSSARRWTDGSAERPDVAHHALGELRGFASIVHSTSSYECIDSDSVYSSIGRRRAHMAGRAAANYRLDRPQLAS